MYQEKYLLRKNIFLDYLRYFTCCITFCMKSLSSGLSSIRCDPRGKFSFVVCVTCSQGRNEGGKGSTIPRAPNHCEGAEMCQRRRKYLRYICFHKTLGMNMGTPNWFLAQGAI